MQKLFHLSYNSPRPTMDASMDAVATDALASSNAWNQRKNTAQSTLDRSGTIRISVEHSFKKV